MTDDYYHYLLRTGTVELIKPIDKFRYACHVHRSTRVHIQMVCAPKDNTLKTDMDIFKLNPTDKQFTATAAFVINMMCPKDRIEEVAESVAQLWSYKEEDKKNEFLQLWESCDMLIKHCFGISARVGFTCGTCFKLKFEFDAMTRHNCHEDEYFTQEVKDKFKCIGCKTVVGSKAEIDTHV